MRMTRPLLVMRVDTLWPATWYAGPGPELTHTQAYARRIWDITEAREIVALLKDEIGGVWSIVSDRLLM